MTFDEYKKRVRPGRRVYIIASPGVKIYGTACNLYSTAGEEPAIKLDNYNAITRVTEKNVSFVHMEEAN